MSRAIWKGSISFGLVDIPVALHTATTRDDLSFTLLDRRDMAPVGYRKVNKETGEEVPSEELVKGFEYDEGDYVVLEKEDFQAANREATETIPIVQFVDVSEIPVEFFERPYHLAPVRKKSKGYVLLRETLRETGKVGIATVVLRARQHLCAIMPRGDALVLEILRFTQELRSPEVLELPGSDAVEELEITKKELEMARTLVEGMVEPWDPEAFQDEYREDLMGRIEAKAAAGEVEAVSEPEARPDRDADVVDIMDLLKKSVEKNRKRGKKKSA